MKHASTKILQRLRWLYVLYSLHFVVGYIFAVFVADAGIKGSAFFSLQVAAMASIHLVYEAASQIRFYRRSPWTASLIGAVLVLIVTVVAFAFTGVYLSPYIAAAAVLTFLVGAYSQYFPPAIGMMFMAGYLLSLAGVFSNKDGGSIAGGIFITVEVAVIIGSWFFWNRYTSQQTTPELEHLSRSLNNTRTQSNIILNAIEDGVVLLDQTGVISMFNPGAAKITGWTPEEAVGLDWNLVFKFKDEKTQEPDEQTGESLMEAFGKGESIRNTTANLVTKSQKILTINISGSPLIDPVMGLTGGVCVFRDITKERAEEMQRAEFISTASHEMRTPVAAIEGYIALALNDKVSTIDTRARDYLEKAHMSTQHLGKLFQDLLTSAKAEDGRLSSHPTVIEVGAYLQQISEDLKFSAQKKGLFVEFTVGAGDLINASNDNSKVIRPLYYILADPDRMREVITNLFDNAVKYTETGKISIGLTGNKDVTQIYIRDTGPGIPSEDQPHLFQKFYRVDNSSTRTTGGTGLGLFICRKIVELYQGRIWVESALGSGSTFFINLPRISPEMAKQYTQAEASNTALPTITSLASS